VKWARSALIALALIAGLSSFSASAQASTKHPTYALGKAKHCKTGYIKTTERKKEKVREKKHGKWVEVTITVRYAACEYIAVAAKGPVTAPTTTSVPTSASPAPVVTASTTTTTTTTTIPPAPAATANIATVFIDPSGMVTVTGQFVGVTSLVFAGTTDPSTGLVNTCTAVISGQSGQCTLSFGNAELGITPADLEDEMTGGHVYPDILAVSSAAGLAYIGMGAQTASGFWEYPVATPQLEPLSADGPVGALTVESDPNAESDCGQSICSLVTIEGDFSSTGSVTIWSNDSPPSILVSAFSVEGDTMTIAVPEDLATLQATGIQLGWSGGYNYGKYGFPSESFPYWPTNRVVTYDPDTGTWS
jgi:hypothetical protein